MSKVSGKLWMLGGLFIFLISIPVPGVLGFILAAIAGIMIGAGFEARRP